MASSWPVGRHTGPVDVGHLSGTTLYIVVFAMIFIESGVLVGFWLPGDTILFAAGLVAADSAADVSIYALSGGVAIAASLGAATGYYTGARLGRPYLERRHASALVRTEEFYRRFGSVTLIAARFVPWARTFAPVLAGAVAMPRSRFLAAAAAGALVWGSGLILVGYVAAEIPGLRDAVGWFAAVVVLGSVLAGIGGELLRRRATRRRTHGAAATTAVASAPATESAAQASLATRTASHTGTTAASAAGVPSAGVSSTGAAVPGAQVADAPAAEDG
ncbi:membrane-associated protein [Frankia sp. AiPs1]|uniref:DedA family protein n=1 Tax=Frankia sp. AiPa1 TaxID=573492 RepID=UPI00202B331A|nr:DedA family protein [Frankia sp. AiPa1]MCL9759002.1 DedA family protein [Frankia sp. AiPa1]